MTREIIQEISGFIELYYEFHDSWFITLIRGYLNYLESEGITCTLSADWTTIIIEGKVYNLEVA